MKTTKIKTISIKNFKGIANGIFNFNGENTEIVADVMQGKSTIKDAYLFVLGMEIDNFYPCDKNNQLIDGLETRIEVTLSVDGIEYVLSRSAKIKWKVNKETDTKSFDGYKKDIYDFDRVPCNATEYKTKLCDLLGVSDFNTLKYLTVLNYFNEQVGWKERRELIYNLFVDRAAIDSLKDNAKYDLIRNELLKGKSSADISTMLNSENNRLVDNKRRNEILLADKQIEFSGFEKVDYSTIEIELVEVEKDIQAEQERIDGLDTEAIKSQTYSKILGSQTILNAIKGNDRFVKEEQERKIGSIEILIDFKKKDGLRLEKQIEELTAEYKTLKTKEFDESKAICPTCGQPLKQADIDELRSTWVNNREQRLSSLKTEILSLKKQYEEIKTEYTDKLAELESEKAKLAEFKPNLKIEELEAEIANLQAKHDSIETAKIDTSRLDELKAERNKLIVALGKKDSYEKLQAKISDLISEQRELVNAEIALAKKRQQLEQYTLDIIGLVNDSINSHFDGVKFKLFEELTATAKKDIKETLVCLNNGVDYVSQSTGQKAMTNCIIVSTLQKRLGVNIPIWLDDASILNLSNPPSNQLIYLLNEKGKKLNCTKIDEVY